MGFLLLPFSYALRCSRSNQTLANAYDYCLMWRNPFLAPKHTDLGQQMVVYLLVHYCLPIWTCFQVLKALFHRFQKCWPYSYYAAIFSQYDNSTAHLLPYSANISNHESLIHYGTFSQAYWSVNFSIFTLFTWCLSFLNSMSQANFLAQNMDLVLILNFTDDYLSKFDQGYLAHFGMVRMIFCADQI